MPSLHDSLTVWVPQVEKAIAPYRNVSRMNLMAKMICRRPRKLGNILFFVWTLRMVERSGIKTEPLWDALSHPIRHGLDAAAPAVEQAVTLGPERLV